MASSRVSELPHGSMQVYSVSRMYLWACSDTQLTVGLTYLSYKLYRAVHTL
jgi:hypothetical protein